MVKVFCNDLFPTIFFAMTCSLQYSARVPDSVDLYDFQFETCFSMFQTVLMTMMTVMTMTENMFRTPTPSVLICLKQLETCSYEKFQTDEIFAGVHQ